MKIGVVEFHPQRRRGAFGPLQLVVCVNCFGKWWLVSACMCKMKCDKEKNPIILLSKIGVWSQFLFQKIRFIWCRDPDPNVQHAQENQPNLSLICWYKWANIGYCKRAHVLGHPGSLMAVVHTSITATSPVWLCLGTFVRYCISCFLSLSMFHVSTNAKNTSKKNTENNK